jgi:hypothetical protein
VAGDEAGVVGSIGVAALAVLTASVAFGWTSGIAWTLALLAAEYAAALAARDASTVDAGAPLVGAGLLVVAELAYWSLERRGPGSEEARLVVRRLAVLGGLALGSVLLGAFVVVVTAAPLGGGFAWDLVGVLAAAGTLAIVYRLVRAGGA